jgi:activating signal cointegrator 1
MLEIPAITLWQPWASLLACGAKKYETRGWETEYRGPIAIHAAALNPFKAIKSVPENIVSEMRRALKAKGILTESTDFRVLPLGCIIAVAELTECWKITANGHTIGSDKAAHIVGGEYDGKANIVEGREMLFGDWTPSRYAWEFANVKILPEPILAKGKQGLWKWQVPEGTQL